MLNKVYENPKKEIEDFYVFDVSDWCRRVFGSIIIVGFPSLSKIVWSTPGQCPMTVLICFYQI